MDLAKQWSERDLIASLKQVGPLLPVYWHRGKVLDGARRRKLCHHLRIRIRHVAVSDDDMPRMLWLLAPDRALQRWLDLPMLEKAELFGVSPSQLALAQARPSSAARLRRAPPHDDWSRLNLRLPARKLEQLKERARKRNLTLSHYIRELL